MRAKTRLTAFFLCSFLASCAAHKIAVSWESDPAVSLSNLRTYAWFPGPQPPTGDPRIDDRTLDRRIRAAIDLALAERGYVKTDADHADFWVDYYARLDPASTSSTVRSYSGYGPRLTGVGRERGWNVGGPPITYTMMSDVGSLNLFVVNPKTQTPVWHAVAQAEIDRMDSLEKRDQRLLEAARAMLAKLPPLPPQQ